MICVALPEATEKAAWSTPTFRVRDKIFAQYAEDLHGDTRVGVWCKAPLGAQEMLVNTDPERLYVPWYVGHRGWIGVQFDVEDDWEELADLIAARYLMTAPRRLAALIS